MAKDDYHVIVYQILSYLYQTLKAGETVDPERLECAALFGINEKYRSYVFQNLQEDGLIKGLSIKEGFYINGEKYVKIDDYRYCEITPKGIEYLTDNSFMAKAKEFFKDMKSIVPFV